MAIENRELPAGTRLVARYKKETFVCTVEAGEEGKPAYVLEDGRRFTSPSAAGSAVMGGVACNGWRFWSVEGGVPPTEDGATPENPKAAQKGERGRTGNGEARARRPRPLLNRTPNQQGVPEGQVRWFCDACMAGFTAPAGEAPKVCPEGHRADDPQLVAG